MAEAEVLGHWALLAKLTLEDSGDGPLSRVTEETLLEVTAPAIGTGLLIPVLSVATYVHAHVYILLAEKPTFGAFNGSESDLGESLNRVN